METPLSGIYIKIIERVLTVPMRNGNTKYFKLSKKSTICSYRTYEEWKLSLTWRYTLRQTSSYRTYEEWKLNYQENLNKEKESSYRTYEEWKQNKTASLF